MRIFIKKLWDLLGSRNLSVFIFIMGLTYVAFLVVFGMLVPLPWVNNISKLLPFKVLYILFFINLIICELKWVPVTVRRCKARALDNLKGNNTRCRIEIPVSEFNVLSFSQYLRQRFYKIQEIECSGNVSSPIILHAHKGRFSPIGNLFFHISFLFFFIGVLISMMFRFEGRARVTEGYQFSGDRGGYYSISASPMSSFPELSFYLEKITPKFWKDELLFTELRADLQFSNTKGSAMMSKPLSVNSSSIIINGVGITPMYVLRNKSGRELDVSYVNLGVFTPGSEDHFQIPGFPHQVFVSFYPDHEIVDGKIINRSMNPVNPAYYIKVFRGRLPVFTGVLKQGDEAVFEDLKLSFPEFKYWGDFRIINDRGLVFVWMAFILMGVGLVWRILFYRREIILTKEDNSFYLYGRSDYYPRLLENDLRTLSASFGESSGDVL